jgi:hemolysin activation/secretion protein
MQSLTKKSGRAASYLFTLKVLVVSQLAISWVAYAQEPAPTNQNPAAQASPAQTNQFDLYELRVKGNTLLERQAIERTVYPFLGKQKSIDVVENARTALENLYHSKGYQTIAVDIPEQNVVNGIVYLQVTEGKVSRLRVTESRYFSLGAIKEKVPALAEGSVPNMPLMQEQLAALAKESPDRTVTPILRAGDTPGSLEVDLRVKDELPLHGKLELNGRNTATTDRLRAIASLHYDNLWQKFHSASIMYQTTPENPNQVEVVVGSYVMPIIDSDKRLAFFALNSSSNSITNAGALSVVGAGDIYGLRFVDPLITNVKNLYQTFTAGVSYKNFQQNLSGQQVGALFRQTPISYLPFLLGYSGNLKLDEATLGLTLNANFSLRDIGNNQGEFENSRYLAKSDYAYLNGGLSFTHTLPYGMEFQSRFNGQVADSPLIPNEQFSIGGMQSVRGYYETQVLADSGMQTSIELYSPRVDVEDWPDYNKIRGLIFFDAGKGWMQDALSGSPSQYSLASAGSGFRVQLWKKLTANFDVGVPFVNQTRVERGNPRLHFQVFTEF